MNSITAGALSQWRSVKSPGAPQRHMSVDDLAHMIRKPPDAIRTHTEAAQAAYRELATHYLGAGTFDEMKAKAKAHPEGVDLLARYDAAKERLPVFTAHGAFSERGNENLIAHAGYQMYDADGVHNAALVRDAIAELPETELAHVTPSGYGVRALVRIAPTPTSNAEQGYAFTAVEAWALDKGLPPNDPACKNLERLSFIAHDPDVRHTPGNGVVRWTKTAAEVAAEAEREAERRGARGGGDWLTPDDYREALAHIAPPQDYGEWLDMLFAAKDAGLTAAEVEAWSAQGAKHTQGEVERRWATLKSVSRGITAGTLIHHARRNGYKTPGDKRSEDFTNRNLRKADALLEKPAPGAISRQSHLDRRADDTGQGAAIRMLETARYDIALVKPTNSAEELHFPIWRTDEGRWRKEITYGLALQTKVDLAHIEDTLASTLKSELEDAAQDTGKQRAAMKRYDAARKSFIRTHTEHFLEKSVYSMMDVETQLHESAGMPFKVLRLDEKDVDSDLRYLGCANGIVDLYAARLLPPEEGARKFVTLNTGVDYTPGARHPDVDALIGLTQLGDKSLSQFALDAFAWALRGSPAKRLYLLFDHNGTNTGKSTLMQAMRHTLGADYCAALSPDITQGKQRGDKSATPELYALTQARIAFIEEAQQAKDFTTSRVNNITGGGAGTITYRRLYKDPEQAPLRSQIFAIANGQLGLDLTNTATRGRYTPILFQSLPDDAVDAKFEQGFAIQPPAVGGDAGKSQLQMAELGRLRREALLAMLIERAAELDAPPDIPEKVKEIAQAHTDDSLGEAGAWIMAHLTHTRRITDFTPTADAWDAISGQFSGDGKDGVGMSRPAFTKLVTKLLQLSGVKQKRVYGKVERGWQGVRLQLDAMDAETDAAETAAAETWLGEYADDIPAPTDEADFDAWNARMAQFDP